MSKERAVACSLQHSGTRLQDRLGDVESELVCSFQYSARQSLLWPEEDQLGLSLECPRWRFRERPDISLDEQVKTLRADKAVLTKVFVDMFVILQRDLLAEGRQRLDQIRRAILELMKGYAEKGKIELKPDALSLMASRLGFRESTERMARALDSYLQSNEQVVDTVTIQAFNDIELQKANLEVILSVDTNDLDAMLGFRKRLCDYLDSVLSDDDKVNITTTVERSA